MCSSMEPEAWFFIPNPRLDFLAIKIDCVPSTYFFVSKVFVF